ETGRDINPHIPHYISQAPWYLDIQHPTLKHQRIPGSLDEPISNINEWHVRAALPAATRYRKGACKNCGAMTHSAKECVERPRAKGAKWTGRDIARDEILNEVELGFEAKRDRWNGYDPAEHIALVDEWDKIDEKRRMIREQQVKEKLASGAGGKEGDGDGDYSSDEEDDEDKYADRADMPGQKLDTKTRTTVRNLRIREDTAKYLINLDTNSAYYDPKTRSMRDNPNMEKDPDQVVFGGDNFLRYTGDAPKMAQLQSFAWEAESRGNNVHLQANPTQGELLYKQFQTKKEKLADNIKDSILARYGGEEHLQAPQKELLLAQTEHYVEYSQTGRVIKGQEKAAVKSKYEEDVFMMNHTAVWGSWWKAGRWGYACCHSYMKQAYCTGAAGIEAQRSSETLLASQTTTAPTSDREKTLLEKHVIKAGAPSKPAKRAGPGGGNRLGEGEVDIDQAKLKAAIEAERKRKADDEEDRGWGGAKGKRGKYSSAADVKEVTEEELEAYRMEKVNSEDPMANFVDEDD
ncbi:Pre-mRNA splicing Prp18-interacting factor-domain-containing protein, partial [Blyttiomyces helicus]